MGYTTDFSGHFEISPALNPDQIDYLTAFSETRRMKRDPQVTASLPDKRRLAVGLPIGVEGEFFVGGKGFMGQDNDNGVIDLNSPPQTQPGLWCQWVPSSDGTKIEWDEGEKFYDYIDWINYINDNFLKPWGCVLHGDVTWEGEESDDIGLIEAVNGVITVHEGPYRKYLQARNIKAQQERLAEEIVPHEDNETGADIMARLKGEITKNLKI